MSEEVLKALMQLFGITARLDGVTEVERELVYDFLNQQLNQQDVPKYFEIFEQYATQRTSNVYEEGVKLTPVRLSSRMLRLTTQIIKELTQQQKVIVLIRLLELVNVDHRISPQEEDFVDTVATVFNIEPGEYQAIKRFVMEESPLPHLQEPLLLCLQAPPLPPLVFEHAMAVPQLQGAILILRVPSVESYFVKYIGDKEYYLNGVLMHPLHIYPLPPGSSIRGGRIEPIYYSDVVRFFLKEQHRQPIVLHARNISYRFPSGVDAVKPLSMKEYGGNLVGIMGASGSGKSTLIELLAGIKKPSKGTVTINGVDVHAEEMAGIVGFVPQQDLLIEELTVYENLYYAARLCFGNLPEEDIKQKVEKTLQDLGLYEVRHLAVGNEIDRILSGGQRKRLNIALELLREPSVLFVDEPTSGLSSRDSENVMDLLKELALKGKLVITVLHQPSSDIFKMLDSLYILDLGGYLIYSGKPADALIYFKKAANQVNSEHIECHECGNIDVEQIFDIIEMRVVDEYGRFTNRRKRTPRQWHALFQKYLEENNTTEEDEGVLKPLESHLVRPSFLKQWFLFALRDARIKLSSPSYITLALLQAPALAFLLAYINRYYPLEEGHSHYTLYHNSNLPAYIFVAVIIALFMGMTIGAEEILKDRRILFRERFLALNRHSYLLAKTAVLFAMSAVQTTLLVLVGNLTMRIEWALFDEYWLVLFSTACFANLLALNLSSAFKKSAVIYIAIPVLLIPQLILGGVVVRFDRMNPSLVAHTTTHIPAISHWMASRWAFEALMLEQFRDNSFMRPQYEWKKQIAESEYKAIFLYERLRAAHDSIAMGQRPAYWASMIGKTIENDHFLRQHPRYVPVVNMLKESGVERLSAITPMLDSLLRHLRAYYMERGELARLSLRRWTGQQSRTDSAKQAYQALHLQTHNEAVERFVNNIDMGNFVRLTTEGFRPNVYLAYLDGEGFFSHFFAPNKWQWGRAWDTFYVNLLVIWLMSLLLYWALYVRLLERSMLWLEQWQMRRRRPTDNM
ncbi:ATP-binding cassette domain-containing protein [Thermonema rossianum]|uniref:ATP-binding cassette domain-containing protein n=1 Tax=Thermonema rossianum TaxID=55505 RepID=UPI00056E34D6|nr:ATP-binding cassette domain-containing protein [Thermonema rossianum]